MSVRFWQVLVVPLPQGKEVALYLDSERPNWTGPAVWRWREGRSLDVGCRIPLTRCGVRVVIGGLAAA